MITNILIEKLAKSDPKLASYLMVLQKFSVAGFEKQIDMDTVCKFLETNKVPFERNLRHLVWTESLSDGLKKQFKKP